MRPKTKKPASVRHYLAGLAISLLLPLSMGHAAVANDTIYQIDLNKTQILRLPAAAGAIVVGNPDIADVSIHASDIILVVGRGFGETNLVILDQAGHTMMDANIQVTSVTSSNGIRIFNGKSRETYSCAPFCQPSPVLGDDSGFIGANSGQSGAAITQTTVFDTPIVSAASTQIQQATQTPGSTPSGPAPTSNATSGRPVGFNGSPPSLRSSPPEEF